MGIWNQVSAGDIFDAIRRILESLGDDAEKVITRINTDPAFVREVASFMTGSGHELSTSQKIASQIMGSNFFSIDEVIEYFGIKPKKRQLARLERVPWSSEQLMSCKDTHVLVPVFPLSITDMSKCIEKYSSRISISANDISHIGAAYKDNGKTGWQLVRKRQVPDSLSKTWDFNDALLSEDEEVPASWIVVYSIIVQVLADEGCLLEGVSVRCNPAITIGSCAEHVEISCLSDTDKYKISISTVSDGCGSNTLGLAAAKKQ